jgi:hypothetical protein
MRLNHPVMTRPIGTKVAVILSLGCLALAGCASKNAAPPITATTAAPVKTSGFHLFSRKAPTAGVDNPVAIGVNSYLWRASLDVLNFAPLASADPYGGLIVTDWYTNPEKTDERFKIQVYILDTRLRADGVNVSVSRQTKGADGQWVNATASSGTEAQLEDAIIARARSIRIGAD